MTSKDLCRIYSILHEDKLVSFPLIEDSRHKTESIVANITQEYYGHQIYSTAEEKAVAYLYFVIKGHPFIDGNKRTAVLVFEIICELNNLKPNYDNILLDELAVFIEKKTDEDHQVLIKDLTSLIFKK